MTNLSILVSALLCTFALTPSLAAAQAGPQSGRTTLQKFTKKPKLVVVVVIDQFRSDFLTRFAGRMRANPSGGLSYLMKNGAYFPFAKYDSLQSITCPGHASILTGAYPYQTGIPVNEWYDSEKKTDVYCAEDVTSPIVGRAAKPEEGVSPRRLQASTVGDELKMAGYKSQVVAIALKDRSAVMMGGHRADLALWIEDGKWVSSKYYLPEEKLPSWVENLNTDLEKEKGSKFSWKILGKASGLTDAAPADAVRETVAGTVESFDTPYGVKLTTDAAIRALKELKLGKGGSPDILAVSYSSHDLLGHKNGLQSYLMEEMTVFEDTSIGELVRAIDKQVGLANVVFAFTGDHGVGPAVDIIKPQGMPAGNLNTPQLMKDAEVFFEKKWGKSSKGAWIARVKNLGFYLNPEVLIDKKKSRTDVEAELKRFILSSKTNGETGRDGVAHVFTRSEWEENLLPPGRFERQIKKTYIPGKSGDVILIPKPFWVDRGAFATHVTGYNYDRSVPLIIVGGGVKAGVYAKDVEVVDLAPTLSFILGLVAPSGSDGRVLHEIF